MTSLDESVYSVSSPKTTNHSETSGDIPFSQIEIPCAILASPLFAFAMLFIVFDYIENHKILIHETEDEEDERKTDQSRFQIINMISPRGWANGDMTFGILMLIGVSCFITIVKGHSSNIGVWGFSFATKSDLRFTKENAAYLMSVTNLFRLISRLVASACSLFVPVQVLLFVETIATAVSCGLLAFGLSSQLTLWIFLCAYKFFSSSLWPTAYAWTNRYVNLSVALHGWVGIITSLIDIGTDNLVGYLLQNVSQISFMYLCFGLSSFGIVVLVVLQIIASRHGDRFADANKMGKGAHCAENGKGDAAESELFISKQAPAGDTKPGSKTPETVL